MEGSEMTNIPSDEDFARASLAIDARRRGLSEASEIVKKEFQENSKLTGLSLFVDNHGHAFRACLFFESDAEAKRCEDNGTVGQIVKRIKDELKRRGRVESGKDSVIADVVSDEHLRKVGMTHGDWAR